MAYTLGPWSIGAPHHENPNGERYNANCITANNGAGVCQVYGIPMQTTLREAEALTDPRYKEGLANANLISAAPELLEALKRCETLLKATANFIENNPVAEYTVNYDETTCDGYCLRVDCDSARDEVISAIRKAEGHV